MFVNVTIEGISPLICNRFTDEAALDATNGKRGSSASRDRGTPMEQAEKKLYYGADGKTLIVPSPNLLSCLIGGGAFFKNGRSKITTQRSSLIPSCVSIQEAELPIKHREPWTVDIRAVRIPATGGRVLAYRPIFNDWEVSCTLELDTDELNVKLLRDIVDAAGRKVGLGDFRPSCKGPYGRFAVTRWVVEDAKPALKKAA